MSNERDASVVTLIRRALSLRPAERGEEVQLREFLIESFSREELEQFCADYFREVYLDFEGSSAPKSYLAQQVVEYCRRRDQIGNLLAALQKERAEPFARHFTLAPLPALPPRARDRRQIFISHAHEDRQIAQRLARDLRREGYTVWIAPDSIQPGESWLSAIDRGLHESGVFLALLSPAGVRSQWVKSETRVAIQLEHRGRMRLLPVMIRPCDPAELSTFLASYQSVSAFNRYEQALPELLVELGSPRAKAAATAIARGLRSGDGRGEGRPRRLPKHIQIDLPVRLQLARIPAGSFWMGSHPNRDAYAQPNEGPRHRVHVSDFYMARLPVTNEQYAVFAQATQRDFKLPPGKEDHPVVNLSWLDADAFCQWLGQMTGLAFALPTEAQWEKAARGTDGRIYPWGDAFDQRKLNCFENNIHGTTPAGAYSPEHDSPYGIADMCGNAWEWCADWYSEDEYQRRRKGPLQDPRGPEQGALRVLRGGAFDFNKGAVRCAYRVGVSPYERSYDYGFRMVMLPS